MSPSPSPSRDATIGAESRGPTLVQRPAQHEGLRRALASSFEPVEEEGDFQGLLQRLR